MEGENKRVFILEVGVIDGNGVWVYESIMTFDDKDAAFASFDKIAEQLGLELDPISMIFGGIVEAKNEKYYARIGASFLRTEEHVPDELEADLESFAAEIAARASKEEGRETAPVGAPGAAPDVIAR